MADDVATADAASAPEQPRPNLDPPPPLTSIRVKGPGARGLNKPAILIAAAGGLVIILLLASNGLSGDSRREPPDARPMMSDPARPEMAQGAVRPLPSTYIEAAAREAASRPPLPPRLGPPLPGDVAAFAPDAGRIADDWSAPSSLAEPPPPDPAIEEARLADRSTLFFALRLEQQKAADPQRAEPRREPLTAIGPAQSDQAASPDLANRALFPGTVIPASLITGIDSQSPGPVIAQVTQTVYDSATGSIPLMPQGARLIGDYKSNTRYGQTRIAIFWSRLIMPDGDEILLDEAATDPSGAAGVHGRIDNHWVDVFGAAVLGTIVSIGVASTEEPALTFNGVGAASRDPADAAIAEGVQLGASAVTSRTVDRSLAIPPTINVDAGARVSVIVTRRLILQP